VTLALWGRVYGRVVRGSDPPPYLDGIATGRGHHVMASHGPMITRDPPLVVMPAARVAGHQPAGPAGRGLRLPHRRLAGRACFQGAEREGILSYEMPSRRKPPSYLLLKRAYRRFHWKLY
jgi:hypothetical protein